MVTGRLSGLLWFVVLLSLAPMDLCAQATAVVGAKDYSKEAFVVEKIDNKIKFENDGTYLQDSTVRVRVQSAAGVQGWGVIGFPYPSTMGDAEFVSVTVTKANGTIVTTPTGNVQDMPAQITIDAPFYSDLKVKQLAVKGLDVGDVLDFHETFHARSPLIPGQFWYSRDFYKAGVVLDEELQLVVPSDRAVKVKSPKVAAVVSEKDGFRTYVWRSANLDPVSESDKAKDPGLVDEAGLDTPFADVQLTSFRNWDEIGQWYRKIQADRVTPTPEVQAKAQELTRGMTSEGEKIRVLYNYVSVNFRYIGISFGIGRYQPHPASEVLSNGYGDCKDKHTLLATLLSAAGIKAYPALINSSRKIDPDVPSPQQFDHMITVVPQGNGLLWLDTTPEVAPFGFLTANIRDSRTLVVYDVGPAKLVKTPADPPFKSLFTFQIAGKITPTGTLEGKAEATLRGDDEVIFRAAFRRAPQSRWQELLQAVSIGWNFAGTVSDVRVSSPEATNTGLQLDYSYTRKDYPNWPDAIRAPLPPLPLTKLPDDANQAPGPFRLGSPEDFDLDAKLELPSDMSPKLCPKIDVKKDFAEYHSFCSMDASTLHMQRRLTIFMHEIPRTRIEEYRAFWKVVNDDADSVMSISSSGQSPSGKGNSATGEISSDSSFQRILDLGDQLFYQSDLSGAIAQYRKAVQLRPQDYRAHRDLANVLYNNRNYDAAIEEDRQALRIQPGSAESHSRLADALTYKNDYPTAISEYREALRLKPDIQEAHRGLGGALYATGEMNEALTEYREAVRLDPQDADAQSGLGGCLQVHGDSSGAAAAYRQAIRFKPGDSSSHEGLASALFYQRELDGALAEYREAIRLKPDYARAHEGLGDTLMLKQDPNVAIDEYNEVLRLEPTYPHIRGKIAQALILRGDVDQGLARLIKEASVEPPDPDAYVMLASMYAYLNRPDEALAEWTRLEHTFPGNQFAPRAIARILIEKKKYDEAIKEAQPALGKGPNDGALLYLLGIAYARSGDGDKALTAFRKELAIDNSARALNDVSYELANDNVDLKDALAYAESAVAATEKQTSEISLATLSPLDLGKMPTLASHWDTLGWASFRAGNSNEAEQYLNAAWKLMQAPAIGNHLGQFYEKSGNNAQAMKFYALSLATNHAPEGTAEALQRVAGNSTRANKQLSESYAELGAQRTLKLTRPAKYKGTAEFFVIFPKAEGGSVRFVSGPEQFRDFAGEIASAKFDVAFPDHGPEKLVRRAMVDCSTIGSPCVVILLPPETVHSIN